MNYLKQFVSGEIWLGLETVHKITSAGSYSLYILLKDFDQKTYVAVFDQFEVMMMVAENALQLTMMLKMIMMILKKMMMNMQVGPGDDYVLTIGGFNDPLSTLGDSMTCDSMTCVQNLNGMRFSTK